DRPLPRTRCGLAWRRSGVVAGGSGADPRSRPLLGSPLMPLELLVSGGRIATLAGDRGFGWVEAVGITDGRVAFAGSAVDLETRADPFTRRIELDPDEVAIPGLTDAHLHLAEGGLSADRVDLTGTRSLDEGLEAIRAAASVLAASETWLEGHGWLRDQWGVWPTADDLERAAPGRPVALWAHDHHALWVSHRALRIAGVDATTTDPDGGIIRRDESGAPTGILHETAARLVMRHVPPPTAERAEAAVARLSRELIRLGVVAVHDPGALSLQEGLGPAIAGYRALDERACRATLDALEAVSSRTPLVPRLEHIQLLHPDDRPRFARAGIGASIQPIHVRSDAASARRLWGDRAETRGYPMRSLLDAGAIVAFGTDAPVEPIDPWPGVSMAVTRVDASWGADAEPFGPDERITLEQALRAACIAPAVLAAETDRGRLVPGQR